VNLVKRKRLVTDQGDEGKRDMDHGAIGDGWICG
jgi:hypothetical protein